MSVSPGFQSQEAAPLDPVELTRALIRCPSITPEEGGVLADLRALSAIYRAVLDGYLAP